MAIAQVEPPCSEMVYQGVSVAKEGFKTKSRDSGTVDSSPGIFTQTSEDPHRVACMPAFPQQSGKGGLLVGTRATFQELQEPP